MPNSNYHQLTTALTALGGASLLLVGASLAKLSLALWKNVDFSSALLRSPPRNAYDGRVFWITGASSGIGRALALHICSNYDNVKVILSSRRQDELEIVAAQCLSLNGSNEVKVLPLDLAELSNLPSKAEEALNMFGRVDVLVNNGGVSTRSLAQNSSSLVDEFVAKVDYLSHVSLTKSLLPSWLEAGKSTFNPVIINTSSVAGKLGAPVRTSYCGAKHALQGWFDAFRLELQLLSQPVHILNIVLGSTRTNVARNAIVETVENTFGSNDANIESGLEPEFVVKKVLAAAWAGRQEIWIAPRKEMMMLYLNQYAPEMAKKIMFKYIARQYAVQKVSSAK